MAKREYRRADLVVLWDSSKCEHCEQCWRSLPEVFQPDSRPWVKIDGAEPDRIREVVRQCPPQALILGSPGTEEDAT